MWKLGGRVERVEQHTVLVMSLNDDVVNNALKGILEDLLGYLAEGWLRSARHLSGLRGPVVAGKKEIGLRGRWSAEEEFVFYKSHNSCPARVPYCWVHRVCRLPRAHHLG